PGPCGRATPMAGFVGPGRPIAGGDDLVPRAGRRLAGGELVLEAEALAEYLELSELQAENLRSRGQAAMCAVKMSRGTSCTVPTEPAMEGIDSLVSLRTMSTGGAKGALEPKTTCEPDAAISKRSITSICPALTIEAACNFDLGRSQTAFPHCQKDQLFGDGIARTATVQVEGMLCGVFSNLQVKEDSALFVREVQRKDAHTSNAKATEEEEKNDPGTQTWPQGSPKRLFHTDTLGNVNGFSKRDKLVEEILEGGVHTSPLDHGQTGTVYALEERAITKSPSSSLWMGKSSNAGAWTRAKVWSEKSQCTSSTAFAARRQEYLSLQGPKSRWMAIPWKALSKPS
ncbi:unnamed protein product, partial [Effrenium voratum]